MAEFGFMNNTGGWSDLLFTENGIVTNVTQLIIFLGIVYVVYRIGKVLGDKL